MKKLWLFLLLLPACSNPETPAGYVGYIRQGAYVGKAKFYDLQVGPASTGLGWLLSTINISITPYTKTEEFAGADAVLAKDNLTVHFRVHLIFCIHPDRVKDFVEQFSTLLEGQDVIDVAYRNFLREPLRTYARDVIQQYNGLAIKENIVEIGRHVTEQVMRLTKETPFNVQSVLVGNIQYPPEVTNAVSLKLATTQLLEQKLTEIAIEERDKEKRIIQAQGIAEAMKVIQAQLTNQYLQHEAIEAQKAMVGSPNHTTIYIPVGPMGVPLVATLQPH